ncbi:MAG: TIGR00269 family protein [Promethearchaeota archaeon]
MLDESRRKCGHKPPFTTYHGQIVCKSCFVRLIEQAAVKTISEYKMLSYRDHLGVALSGGKDSIVLLHILKKIIKPHTQFTAIMIDEGIANYREDGLEKGRQAAIKEKVPLEIFSFKSLFGWTLDEVIERANKKNYQKAECAICGILRRQALNISARKVGVDKLATGHHLDDEAQSIIMNILRGDHIRLNRLSRIPISKNPLFVPRLRPLVKIDENQVVLYAFAENLIYEKAQCPYAHSAMRNDIREFLSQQEFKRTGTLRNILRIHDLFFSNQETMQKQKGLETIRTCKKCGEPSNKIACEACNLLELIA